MFDKREGTVKNGFSNPTKAKEKTSQMILKERLSKRAVMKENGRG